MNVFFKSVIGKAVVTASVGTVLVGSYVAYKAVSPNPEAAVRTFASGTGDKLQVNVSGLSADGLKTLLQTNVSKTLTLGNFVPNGVPSDNQVVVNRKVIDALEQLNTTMNDSYPGSHLNITSGYRGQEQDAQLGTGSGPHTRGDAVDVYVDAGSKVDSHEAALRLATEAVKQGVRGVEIDVSQDGKSYSVHIDPVRSNKWYAEEYWETDPVTRKKRPKTREVNPLDWQEPDLTGTWLIAAGSGLIFNRLSGNSYSVGQTSKPQAGSWSTLAKNGSSYAAHFTSDGKEYDPLPGHRRTWKSANASITLKYSSGTLTGSATTEFGTQAITLTRKQ